MNRYISVYQEAIGDMPAQSIDGRLVFDTISPYCAAPLEILEFLEQNGWICDIIRENYDKNPVFRDVTIIMIAWMLKNSKNRLKEIFPLTHGELQKIAVIFGEKI